jgi:hypothetical protein
MEFRRASRHRTNSDGWDHEARQSNLEQRKEALKSNIVTVLQLVNRLKLERRKFLCACRHTQQSRVKASFDLIMTVKYKLHRTRLLLTSLEENPQLIYDPVDGEDILRRLARPEHFNADNKDHYQHSQATYLTGKSAWDASVYKLTLVKSLHRKLLLKLVFVAIRHNAHSK